MSEQNGIGRLGINPYAKDGKILISKVKTAESVKQGILKAVSLIGGFERIIENGDEVLLKPNYNSADPPPASSDPEFLRALVELLFEHGAEEVIVGESSMQSTSTRRTMTKTGALAKLEGSGAEVVFFDEGKWAKVDVNGEYLKHVSLPERALHVDKTVYSCCMKTHSLADFSFSLKLGFGFVKGSERLVFHLRHLREKLVDLNLVLHPNLIIMDGRRCFINGGPLSGDVREPNVIVASGDRIAMDVEAIKIIEGYEEAKLKGDPWSYPQIYHAVKLGLGVKGPEEYRVVEEADG